MAGIWEDREFVSRYSGQVLRIHIVGSQPDAETVTVSAVNAVDGTALFNDRPATSEGDGIYSVALTTADTSLPGYFDIVWAWETLGQAREARTFIWVGHASPDYDLLDEDMQGMVSRVWWRFADLFDSPLGGPYLQTQFQTKFTHNRVAQIAAAALGRLNTIAQPHMTYSLHEPGQFPHERWGALLEHATYVEVIKHLIRSYTEQPNWEGVSVARADRRDYMDRWQQVLEMEQQDLKDALEVFKIAHMGLGRPHVLVSGGVYGNYGPNRLGSGSHLTRPRFYARFY